MLREGLSGKTRFEQTSEGSEDERAMKIYDERKGCGNKGVSQAGAW